LPAGAAQPVSSDVVIRQSSYTSENPFAGAPLGDDSCRAAAGCAPRRVRGCPKVQIERLADGTSILLKGTIGEGSASATQEILNSTPNATAVILDSRRRPARRGARDSRTGQSPTPRHKGTTSAGMEEGAATNTWPVESTCSNSPRCARSDVLPSGGYKAVPSRCGLCASGKTPVIFPLKDPHPTRRTSLDRTAHSTAGQL
jgi:hypothetical protein